MRKNCLLVVAGLAFVLVAAGIMGSMAARGPAGGSSDVALKKPDIIITDMKVNQMGSTASGHDVQVIVSLFNAVQGTSTGPFKVKVEWTEDPTVGWTLLRTGGVANIYNDPSMASLKMTMLNIDHTVPAGKAYKYRATADYMNQVDESKEDNNVASAAYFAR